MIWSRITACAVLIASACGASIWAKALGSADPGEGNAAKGKTLFVRYCTGCHGSGGQGDGYRLLGPDPANLTALTTKKKPDSELLKTIHEGKPNMPAWNLRLSKEDSRDMLAYIRTLVPSATVE
jgi:mono/diheme cytochrome c family protein